MRQWWLDRFTLDEGEEPDDADARETLMKLLHTTTAEHD